MLITKIAIVYSTCTAEKVLMDEMPIIPIYYTGMEFAKKTELTGVILPATGDIDFKFASFSR